MALKKMTVQEEADREFIRTQNMNLFVEAGAGAGKTYMLSARIVDQITKGEALDSFVVITFTKAAAQELLDRIVLVLRDKIKDQTTTEQDREKLQYAMMHIDEMQVSTIHSFCRKILVENAFEANLVMDAQMIEDEEVQRRKRAFFNSWKRSHPEVVRQFANEEIYDWYGSLYNAFDSISDTRSPVLFDEISTSTEAQQAQQYMKVAIQIRDDYHKVQDAETKILTNDALLVKAHHMVMSDANARKKIRERYKHFYVDEFQDTDDLQAEMIWMLASEEKGTLRKNSIFLVGDPKQSIYRFRGAQVSVFNHIRQEMENLPDDLARVFVLHQNFRTNHPLIDDTINYTFHRVLGESYESMQSAKYVQNTFNGTWKCSQTIDPKTDKPYRSVEDQIVQLVHEMVTVCPNEVSYKDFLVITRNTSPVSKLVTKFAEMGIPAAVRAKIHVNDHVLLKNFVAVYCGLARNNPVDRANMITAITGLDYSTFSEEEIKIYEKYLDVFAKVHRFYESTPAGAAQILSEHLEMYAPRDENLDVLTLRSAKIKIQQCIDTLNHTVTGTKEAYAQAMQEYLESQIKRETPLSSTEDAVQIMNVHQTKGLAGKIVIIAQRDKAIDYKLDNLKTETGIYPTFKWHDGTSFGREYACTYRDNETLCELDLTEQKEEMKRLEYVAATRVQQTLIFMEKGTGKDSGWFPESAYEISKYPDINERINTLTREKKEDEEEKEILDDDSLRNVYMIMDTEKLSQQQYISVSPSDFETSGNTGYTPGEEGYQKEERPKGNVFGTVTHRVFELLTNRRSLWLQKENDTVIETCIHQAINESIKDLNEQDVEEFYDYLFSKMKYYTRHVLPEIYEGAVNVYPEYPFAFTLTKDDSKPDFLEQHDKTIYVNGTMDLVVEYTDHVIIYDYKTDSRNGMETELFHKRMHRKYHRQLQLYEFAVSRQFSTKKINTKIIDLYQDC